MTNIEKIKAEVEKRIAYQLECIKCDYRLIGKPEEEIIIEYKQLLSFIDSLLQEEPKGLDEFTKKASEEQPEHGFIETIYKCGKKPNWNIGDTLAYYEFTSDYEGEFVLGKVTNVELDEELEDWLYTFEDGYQENEESLLESKTYRKTNK